MGIINTVPYNPCSFIKTSHLASGQIRLVRVKYNLFNRLHLSTCGIPEGINSVQLVLEAFNI